MLSDLQLAFRRLAQSPGFTAVALLTLAIGIGSATVIFAAVNALYLKPAPWIERSLEPRLLYTTQHNRALGLENLGWNYADFSAVQQRTTTLDGVIVQRDRTVIIAGQNEPERVLGTELSWESFGLFGVPPRHGRPFTAADAEPKAPMVALISHALWQRRFGGDPAILESTVPMNGEPVLIVGIMPAGWRYPDASDIWTPLRVEPEKRDVRGDFGLSGRGRLKPGVTLAQAQAELDAIMGALAQEFPKTNQDVGVRLRPIREEAVERTGRLTLLLFGAVLFVFLIACLNVANLLLSRGAARAKEFALRLALGASRAQLVRQLLAESLALGVAGGIGGVLVALWGSDAMLAAIPVELPFWLRFDFDFRIFVFVFGIAVGGALLFGLVPALRASQPDLMAELKEGGRTADPTGSRSQQLRHALVVAEIAIALVLLVGAGLMMRSFLHLQRVERGYVSANVLTFRTGLPQALFGDELSVPARFFAELMPRLRATPGVQAAGLVSVLPGSDDMFDAYVVAGQPTVTDPSALPLTFIRYADAGYFQALQIPLVAGRHFDEILDRRDSPLVAIVDERLARREFGSVANALGKRIRRWRPEGGESAAPSASSMEAAAIARMTSWAEIVGVMGNIRHRADQESSRPTLYYATHQEPADSNFLSVVLRTESHPAALADAARDATLATNRDIPIYYLRPLQETEFRSFWQVRFFTHLFIVFGGVALLLACIGIYGVMSYHVSLRTRELGLRMALGAQAEDVVRMVVQRGLVLVGIGLGTGLVASFSLAQLLAHHLYGVSPHDPPTFAVVPLLLATVAVVACWLPSRRATRIAPASALRAD